MSDNEKANYLADYIELLEDVFREPELDSEITPEEFDETVIIVVANLIAYKGHEDFVRALPVIARRVSKITVLFGLILFFAINRATSITTALPDALSSAPL